MDIYAVRQELRTKSIYDLPLRVTFYARVSTDSDEQKNSIENQTAYYVDFITKNKVYRRRSVRRHDQKTGELQPHDRRRARRQV